MTVPSAVAGLPPFNPQPVTLKGKAVNLVPLSLSQLDGLCEVGLDPDLWRWIPHRVHNKDGMRAYIEEAQRREAAGEALPFALVEPVSGRVMGSSRYGNISKQDRRVEIGWTWVGKAWQRTRVNTEAKYLLMRHAFESLGALRVELKTDALNKVSRAAIARIGAIEEGTLRSHILCDDGRVRDTVYFSVIRGEWPAVKKALEMKLSRN